MYRIFAIACLLGTLMFLLFSLSTEAQDLSGTIFLQFQSGYSGATEPDIELENVASSKLGKSLFLGVGAAYQVREHIRADFTVTYRGGFEQDVQFGNLDAKADFQSTAAMLGVTYEFNPVSGITPYVNGALGYVYNQLDTVNITQDDRPVATIEPGSWANLGAQFGGGISIPIHNDWGIDVGYRYFDGGKYESSDTILYAGGYNQELKRHVGDFSTNEIVVNLRIRVY